jgi:hypothetical protein
VAPGKEAADSRLNQEGRSGRPARLVIRSSSLTRCGSSPT